MARLRDIEAHRAAISDLVTLAHRDLVAFWASVDLADPDVATAAVRGALPDLIAAYGEAAAEMAAQFYEALRDGAGVGGSFTVDLAPLAPAGQVDSLAGWATGPLRAAVPDAAARALSLLSGGLQRLVTAASRDTIARNAVRDPAGPVYARHASANACAFCALLASRDAVYGSKADAVKVTGGDRRPRGTQSSGERFHDHCHCVAVPVWPGQQIERAPYVKKWDAAYAAAPRGDLKVTLAAMRESLGVA